MCAEFEPKPRSPCFENMIFIRKIFFWCVLLPACLPAQTDTAAVYEYRPGDPNGIEKWYMGRQIAHVMGYHGADWLDRADRAKEERTDKLMKNLDLRLGESIADIGAGSGYHSLLMAPLVGAGNIYAVDIQPEMLEMIKQRANESAISNIKPVLGTEQSANLESDAIDKVLLVDVYHEFAFPKEMMESIFAALKPGGKVFLIEFRQEDSWVPIKPIHKMTSDQAIKELTASGFVFEKNIGNLPWQHCLVFRKP